MQLNLIVIKTKAPGILKDQYEFLGLIFKYHRHGNGPLHYSSELNGLTFEIYPLPKSREVADNTLRLGFEVEGLAEVVKIASSSNWIIKSEPKLTNWGYIAVLQDIDGRKIELKEKIK